MNFSSWIRSIAVGTLGVAVVLSSLLLVSATDTTPVGIELQDRDFGTTVLEKNTADVAFANLSFDFQDIDLRVEKLVLSQIGTIDDGALKNLRLRNANGVVLAGPENLQNGVVIFGEGFLLEKENAKTATLTFDIENRANMGDTIMFEIRSDSQVSLSAFNTEISLDRKMFPMRSQKMVVSEPGISNFVTISADQDNTQTQYLPAKTARQQIGTLDFMPHGDADTEISQVVLRKTGNFSDAILSNIILVDEKGNTLLGPESLSNGQVVLKGNAILATNTSHSISIFADIGSYQDEEKVGLEIVQSQDLFLKHTNSGSRIEVAGDFPLRTPIRSVQAAFIDTQYDQSFDLPKVVQPDTDGAVLGKIDLTSFGKSGEISRMQLTNAGTLSDLHIRNIRLTDIEGNEIAEPKDFRVKKVSLTGNIQLPLGQTSLLIIADISPTAPEGATIELQTQTESDITATAQDGQSLAVRGNFPLSSPQITVGNQSTSAILQTTLLPYESSMTTIVAGQNNAGLATLAFDATENDIELQSLQIRFAPSPALEYLENVRLIDSFGHIISDVSRDGEEVFVLKTTLPIRTKKQTIAHIIADIAKNAPEQTLSFQIQAPKDLVAHTIQGTVPVPVNGNFPLQSRSLRVVSPPDNAISVEFEPIALSYQQQVRDEDVHIATLRLTSPQETTIERLLFRYDGVDGEDIFENIRLEEQNGIEFSEKREIQNGVISFTTPIELEPQTTKTLLLVGDIQTTNEYTAGGFELTNDRFFEFRRGDELPVTANFPLRTGIAVVVPAQKLYCDQTPQPVCAKRYTSCSEYPCTPELIDYTNMCFLRESRDILFFEGECRSAPKPSASSTSPENTTPDTTSQKKKLRSASFEDDVLRNPEEYENPFPDTDTSTLVGQAAQELYRRGIIKGFPDGEFKPYQSVNRAEAAKMFLLARFETIDDTPVRTPYADVPANIWFAPYVSRSAQEGIITGSNSRFRPDDGIVIAEFLKMISKTFQLPENLPFRYVDFNNSEWFAQYAGIAQKYDLFPNNRELYLRPAKKMTRGDFATAIYQYLKQRED